MGKIFELNLDTWNAWLSDKPDHIKNLCGRFPPDRLYLMKSTGYRVIITAYGDGDIFVVTASNVFNPTLRYSMRISGVPSKELEECDVPETGELKVRTDLLKPPDNIGAN